MSAPIVRYGCPVMTVAWDGYTKDDTTFLNFIGGATTIARVFTDYGHRRPLAWTNHRQYGSGIDSQAGHDKTLQDLAGAVQWIQYDWYPPLECFTGDPQNAPLQSQLMTMYLAHRASAYKSLVKFGFMIDPSWYSYNSSLPLPGDGGRNSVYRAWLVTQMQDSQYMRIGGQPVLGVYSYAAMSSGNKTAWLAELDAITAAMVAAGVIASGTLPYIIIQDHNSTAASAHLSKASRLVRTTYGPNPGPSGFAGPGRYAWDVVRSSDVTLSQSPGGGEWKAVDVTAGNDARPKGASDNIAFADQPTMPELQSHISRQFEDNQTGGIGLPDLLAYHALSENTETGHGVIPTVQELRRYLDVMLWYKTGVYPQHYMYSLCAAQTNFTRTGTWTESAVAAGPFDGTEVTSVTTNDKVEFSHVRCRHLGVLATKGPDRGIANIYIADSGGAFTLVTTVDLYAASVSYQNQVFMSTRLGGGTCSIRVEVSGTKNASSSSNKIGWDACRIVYNP